MSKPLGYRANEYYIYIFLLKKKNIKTYVSSVSLMLLVSFNKVRTN